MSHQSLVRPVLWIWAAAGLVLGAGCQPSPTPGPGPSAAGPTTSPPTISVSNDKPTPKVAPRFKQVGAISGVEFLFHNDEVPNRFFLPEVMGGGAAWFDFDLDGRQDLYLLNGCPLKDADPGQTKYVNRLYRNVGKGRFTELAEAAHAADNGYGQGCAVGDYDADGFPDLYLCGYGKNTLLHNNGDGTFSDVTDEAGVQDLLWSTSTLWADLDGDQDLDLYVVNYLNVNWETYRVCEFNNKPGYCGPGEYDGEPDHVFLNNGDGTFTESAAKLGIVTPEGKGLAIAAVDFNNDLKAEIYVANDMAGNFMFSRSRPKVQALPDSDKLYVDLAKLAGCARSHNGQNEASMGIACADFDGDSLVDIFLTHFYSHKNTLYRNRGNLVFQDDSRRTRIAATSFETLGFGTVSFDYDLDGDLDLFVANGHVLGPLHKPYTMRPQLLGNRGRGVFDDLSDLAGPYFRDLWLGRGAAGCDYDDDGDVDLLVTHINRPHALLRNDTRSGNHFIGIKLETLSRVPPVGGRVVVKRGNKSWTRPVMSGGSYLCSGDERLLFGLGDSSEVIDVEVHWPSGKVDHYPGLKPDRYWTLREGHAAR